MVQQLEVLCYYYKRHKNLWWHLCWQSLSQRSSNVTNFFYRFSTACDVVEKQGGTSIKPGLFWETWDALIIIDMLNTKEKGRARGAEVMEVEACLFINNLSGDCHGEFKCSLTDVYASGEDSYWEPLGMQCHGHPRWSSPLMMAARITTNRKLKVRKWHLYRRASAHVLSWE